MLTNAISCRRPDCLSEGPQVRGPTPVFGLLEEMLDPLLFELLEAFTFTTLFLFPAPPRLLFELRPALPARGVRPPTRSGGLFQLEEGNAVPAVAH